MRVKSAGGTTSALIMTALLSQQNDTPRTASREASEHLEHCYRLSLERRLSTSEAKGEKYLRERDQRSAVSTLKSEELPPTDGKLSVGAEREAQAVSQLGKRMDSILKRSGCTTGYTLWGIDLAAESIERASLLAAFLRAREWSVDEAEDFLCATLSWRRENSIDGDTASSDEFPDDIIEVRGTTKPYIIIRLGKLSKEDLSRVEDLVAWRIRMQERTCQALAAERADDVPMQSQFSRAPRGPVYTLVVDASGLRPYHFGRNTREALSQLTYVFTHYYPDFVASTLIINPPALLKPAWGIVSRLMPAWWGVRLGTLQELK